MRIAPAYLSFFGNGDKCWRCVLGRKLWKECVMRSSHTDKRNCHPTPLAWMSPSIYFSDTERQAINWLGEIFSCHQLFKFWIKVGLCPGVPVHRGNNHCTPLFTNLCLAVEHCWVFCIGSWESVHEDRTQSRLVFDLLRRIVKCYSNIWLNWKSLCVWSQNSGTFRKRLYRHCIEKNILSAGKKMFFGWMSERKT